MAEGKDYYKTLMSVAEKKGFDFDQLSDMFIAESSGRPDVVNPSGYTGGFQFGEKTGKEYGLVGEGFDFRKDLEKSASAAIDMYKAGTKDFSKNVSGLIKERDLSPGTVGYLVHQQGRFGFQDIITGAKSGKIGSSTRKNILANIGDEDWSDFSDKEIAGKYLDFWKTRYSEKTKEAEKWRSENRPVEDIPMKAMLSEERKII
jgi:hypothetical protein